MSLPGERLLDAAVGAEERETWSLPDLSSWDQRPKTQIIPEKCAGACPYLGGSERKPRDIRTLRRWRKARRGPAWLKIGGRYYYTVAALREFYERSVRGESR